MEVKRMNRKANRYPKFYRRLLFSLLLSAFGVTVSFFDKVTAEPGKQVVRICLDYLGDEKKEDKSRILNFRISSEDKKEICGKIKYRSIMRSDEKRDLVNQLEYLYQVEQRNLLKEVDQFLAAYKLTVLPTEDDEFKKSLSEAFNEFVTAINRNNNSSKENCTEVLKRLAVAIKNLTIRMAGTAATTYLARNVAASMLFFESTVSAVATTFLLAEIFGQHKDLYTIFGSVTKLLKKAVTTGTQIATWPIKKIIPTKRKEESVPKRRILLIAIPRDDSNNLSTTMPENDSKENQQNKTKKRNEIGSQHETGDTGFEIKRIRKN